MKNKVFSKKVLIIVLIIILVIAGIGYGIYYLVKNNKKEVPVYSVSDIGMTDYWQDSNYSDGVIKEDKSQSIYLSSTQKIDKILVKEGDTVKKGTLLIKYNTTLSSLEVEKKQIEIKKMELELENENKKLEEIKNYVPNETIDNSQKDNIQNTPVITKKLKNLSEAEPNVPAENEISPKPITGEGTLENPYVFLWSEDKEYDQTFISKLISRTGNNTGIVYGIFMIREGNELSGELESASLLKFTSSEGNYTFSIVKNSGIEDPIYEEIVEDVEVPKVEEEPKKSYTMSEIKKMIIDEEAKIKSLALDIKVAKSEYKKLKEEIENGTIKSNIDGVIKTVLPIDSEDAKTKPVIVVSGGGGLFTTGRISELNLNKIKVGQKVEIKSYSTEEIVEGTITSISDIPISENNMYGMGNSNMSYYPYEVNIDDETILKPDDYVQITPVEENTDKESGQYLLSAFILDENGKKFIYVKNENGLLEKRQIQVNGIMDTFTKIKSGITENDRVAFPYGKDVKDGAKTVDASAEDLYMY